MNVKDFNNWQPKVFYIKPLKAELMKANASMKF